MFSLSTSLTEIILRALIIYIGVFIIFRCIGKKQLGEMSPFDFVLLLIVSEAVSNGLSGDESSVTGGLVSALTLIGLSAIIDIGVFKSKKLEKIIEGEAELIIKDGKIDEKVLKKFKITHSELLETLRNKEVAKIEDVKFAVLETNGKITVIKN